MPHNFEEETMNHFLRITSFILVIALCCGFGISFTPHFTFRERSGRDTLKRSDFNFSVDHTERIDQIKPLEADSFSAAHFTSLKGITTFRGGPYRDNASVGRIEKRPVSLTVKWVFKTQPSGTWGGGAGWTGQPSIVRWPDSLRTIMNLNPDVINRTGFTEVIFGSLDGNIYFVDLETGKPSRKSIDIKNPIKGSVAIDPRGYPILYCGQGVSINHEFGFRIFSLIDQKLLYYINGYDSYALRGWAAFDGSPLINPKNDRMYLGGENGLFYAAKLNSRFDRMKKKMSINPEVLKYRYSMKDGHLGIENSVAAYHDKIYFADNHGYIQCLDVNTFKPLWVVLNHDDTDASLVVGPEGKIPFLYTGNEVDKQGDTGSAFLKKINGLTGETVWERKFDCLTLRGAHPVNGGLLSTPIAGKLKGRNKVIFCLSRYHGMDKGLLIALDRATGKTVYEVTLNNYTWSSPVDFYDREGNLYIFLADSGGHVMLLDGDNGKVIYRIKIANLFEASPIVFDNKIIIPSRPDEIFCLEIE